MQEQAAVATAFQATFDLFETGVRLMYQIPAGATQRRATRKIERALREWLQRRPGAEFGDCPGVRLDVNTRLA